METVILILATYAVSAALTTSDGPFGAFVKLRKLKAMKVLECFLCTSVIIGAIFATYSAGNLLDWLILSFAFGGAATAIDRFTSVTL